MASDTKSFANYGGKSWNPYLWAAIAALLMLPLVAMQFTDEVVWTLFDFAFAAALLVGAGLAYEIAVHRAALRKYRWVIGGVILAVVLLIWADGAVGIF